MIATAVEVSDGCRSHRGKMAHISRGMARTFLRKMSAQGKGSGVEVYRCAGCGVWFLGHQPPRAVRMQLKRRGLWS